MIIVIDASVFVAATQPAQEEYEASRRFLTAIDVKEHQLRCPIIVLPECAGALARVTGDTQMAEEAVARIGVIPGLQLITIDLALGQGAAQIAASNRLRGADAIYVAVAADARGTLVTWDREMLERGGSVVSTMTPEQWVERQKQS